MTSNLLELMKKLKERTNVLCQKTDVFLSHCKVQLQVSSRIVKVQKLSRYIFNSYVKMISKQKLSNMSAFTQRPIHLQDDQQFQMNPFPVTEVSDVSDKDATTTDDLLHDVVDFMDMDMDIDIKTCFPDLKFDEESLFSDSEVEQDASDISIALQLSHSYPVYLEPDLSIYDEIEQAKLSNKRKQNKNVKSISVSRSSYSKTYLNNWTEKHKKAESMISRRLGFYPFPGQELKTSFQTRRKKTK